jgi:hypothetical protein
MPHDDKREPIDYAGPRQRRVNAHGVLMVIAIVLVAVTFIAAMLAAAMTFRVLP